MSLKKELLCENDKKSPASFLKDSYGSVNFQPSTFPDGETRESLEEKKSWMVQEHSKVVVDKDKLINYANLSFPLQRLSINKNQSIKLILEQWPFFSNWNFLSCHFRNLMDFDILKRFDDALNDKSKDIISFCLQHENLEIVSLANQAKEKATSE